MSNQSCDLCGESNFSMHQGWGENPDMYCHSCLISNPDLLTYEYVVFIRFDEQDQFGNEETVPVYLKSKSEAKDLKEGVLNSSISEMLKDVDILTIEEAYNLDKEGNLSPHTIIARAMDDTNKPFVTDYYVIQDKLKDKIREKLVDEVLNSPEYEEIQSLNEVSKTIYSIHPNLKKYHLTYWIEDEIKSHLKSQDKNQLSERSQKMLGDNSRGNKGSNFEDIFRDFCDENDFKYIKTQQGYTKEDFPNEELKEKFPEIYEELIGNFGTREIIKETEVDKLTGIPDFLVWKKEGTRPIFVEVKYNNSKLTERQKEVFPKLSELGYEVMVFSGTEEKNNLEKLSDFT